MFVFQYIGKVNTTKEFTFCQNYAKSPAYYKYNAYPNQMRFADYYWQLKKRSDA